MTTKTISTYSAGGYVLSAAYGELDITASGGFGGQVLSTHFAVVSNAGRIGGGVLLSAGGLVINQRTGMISGYDGVDARSPIVVTNYGTLQGAHYAVDLQGGLVVNGAYADRTALIAGGAVHFYNSAGSVINYGTIASSISMDSGGSVTNGALADTTALIDGGGGLYLFGGAGTVTNFGTIQAYGAPGHFGIHLGGAGQFVNGAVTDTRAKIEGSTAITIYGSATVTNFGAIYGTGAGHGAYGVALHGGGRVTNGANSDLGALVQGYTGVAISGAAGTVTNFGIIRGVGSAATEYGVHLAAGGTLTNGGGFDRSARIEGANGVNIGGGASATIKNFGTILATGATGTGVLIGQGTLANGSLNNAVALIEGYQGAVLAGQATATNFGAIFGDGDTGGVGILLDIGATVINGAAGHAQATISGYVGVLGNFSFSLPETVVNFGTIIGAGGTAVDFQALTDTLVVEAGCAFVGSILGGGGTLDLDTGVGTLSGLSGDNVTVSGSMAPTTFQNFEVVEIGAAASFVSPGAVSVSADQTVTDAGSLTLGGAKTTVVNAGVIATTGSGALTIAGALSNTGTISANGGSLTVAKAVTGAGVATIDGGTLDLASTFTEDVTFTGKTGVLELGQSQTYTGAITGFSKSGKTSLDLVDIAFSKTTTATYSGTKTGGTLTVTDGTHTAHIALKGDYRTSTFIAASDGHGGTLVHDPAAPVTSWPPWIAPGTGQRFVTAMAVFGQRDASVAYLANHGSYARPAMLAGPRMAVV